MSINDYQLWTAVETPVGILTLTASERGLSGLFFPVADRSAIRQTAVPEHFAPVVAQLEEYFAGTRREFELALDLSSGTAFQQSVWQALPAIPYGDAPYGQLASGLGNPGRVRAVGAANGANPVSIIAPCHRVIGADGRLTGYGGGLDRKRALLDMEAAVVHGGAAAIRLEPAQLTLV